MMRQKMSTGMEQLKQINSNKELHKANRYYHSLKEALDESHNVPVDLLKSVFSQLSLKDEKFKIFESASAEELAEYKLSGYIFD